MTSTCPQVASFFGLGKKEGEGEPRERPSPSKVGAESKSEYVKGLMLDRAGDMLGEQGDLRSDPMARPPLRPPSEGGDALRRG
jgi:hypothetical protein